MKNKIQQKTKQQLKTAIAYHTRLLKSPQWVREHTSFQVGVKLNHIAKLHEELRGRL